jgi:hypothetical protein
MAFFFGFFNHLIYEKTIKMPKNFNLNKSFTSSLLVGFCQTHNFFPFPWLFSLFNILWIIYLIFPRHLLLCWSPHVLTPLLNDFWWNHMDFTHWPNTCGMWYMTTMHSCFGSNLNFVVCKKIYVLWTNFNTKDIGLLLYKNVMNQFPSHIPYWCFWNSKWYNVIFPTFVPLHLC